MKNMNIMGTLVKKQLERFSPSSDKDWPHCSKKVSEIRATKLWILHDHHCYIFHYSDNLQTLTASDFPGIVEPAFPATQQEITHGY